MRDSLQFSPLDRDGDFLTDFLEMQRRMYKDNEDSIITTAQTTGMPGPMPHQLEVQEPDMCLNAPRPYVGQQLELFRREVGQTGVALQHRMLTLMDMNAQFLNRILQQHREDNRDILELFAVYFRNYANQCRR